MALPHDNLVILGLGLIGGSLARAARASGFCRRVTGWGYRDTSLKRGVELGVIDDFTLDLEEAIAAADILVICTPTLTAADVLTQILAATENGERGPVVTDAASVKGNLRDAAIEAAGRMPSRLVLGHPIAGSERSGVDASSAELFRKHRVILTPEDGNDAEAVALVRELWQSTGAEVVEMSVAQHDRVLAATSHLPHALAYALVDALASDPASDDIFRCAAGGFRDFTRIASSDPVMWRDIALANSEALVAAIDQFSAHLGQLRDAVVQGDAAELEATFSRAKTARDRFSEILAERQQG